MPISINPAGTLPNAGGGASSPSSTPTPSASTTPPSTSSSTPGQSMISDGASVGDTSSAPQPKQQISDGVPVGAGGGASPRPDNDYRPQTPVNYPKPAPEPDHVPPAAGYNPNDYTKAVSSQSDLPRYTGTIAFKRGGIVTKNHYGKK